MKTAAVFTLFLATAAAFSSPQFATRAVGAKKAAPAKKAPIKIAGLFGKKAPAAKKAVAKKAAPVKKAVAKKAATVKVAAKKVASGVAPKAPPASQGYPSFAAAAQNFSLGKIGGGGNRAIDPVFVHPTVNTNPPPSYDYVELGKTRLTKKIGEYAYDDGLTVLERKQKATIPAFLSGSAKSLAPASEVRNDIEVSEYPFGLSADRFQLLFITIFGLFTTVGCLSGSISLD